MSVHPEHFGDGRTRDIGVEDSDFVPCLCHLNRERSCHKGFADASLPADNADHMAYIRKFIHFFQKTLLPALTWAALTA
jgi:hypothetical protein